MSEEEQGFPLSPRPMNSYLENFHFHKQSEYDSINSHIQKLFSKKFEFNKDPTSFTLPDVASVFTSEPWKIDHLQVLKSGLDFQRSQLNDYPIEEWSAHTTKRNPAGSIRGGLKSRYNPEFLTQAWTKFYECACSYDIIPESALLTGNFNSLHLCEAPGAFIASLSHFLESNVPQLEWQWLATTLNPYYEDNSLLNMICDDRFIFCTLNNWYFGEDNTGNLMNKKNAMTLIDKASSMGEVHLVTADGSIDCMLKPDQQEECVASLHYCEAITALFTLAKDGSFFLKLFTMYEHTTINLLYLLVMCFESVNIFKPVTSKEGNSEVYVVCIKYCGSEVLQPYKDVLMSRFGREDFLSTAMFPLESLPQDFLDQVHSCAYNFYKLQCEAINSNISTYEKPHMRNENFLYKYRAAVTKTFFKLYCMRPIDPVDKILKGNWKDDSCIHLNPRNHFGTYSERLHLIPQTLEEKLNKYYDELDSIKTVYSLTNVASFQKCIMCSLLSKSDINFMHGKPVQRIGSSKFVLSWILKFYNKIVNEFVNIVFDKDIFDYTDTFETDTNILEFTFEPYLNSKIFDIWEKDNFKYLKKCIESLAEGESLLLKNYTALTQFSVSVVQILAQTSFEKLCFSSNGMIFFENFKNKQTACRIFETIEAEIDRNRSNEKTPVTKSHEEEFDSNKCDEEKFENQKAVLALLPIQVLCEENFYINLLTYNNVFLYTYSRYVLDYMIKNISKTPAVVDSN